MHRRSTGLAAAILLLATLVGTLAERGPCPFWTWRSCSRAATSGFAPGGDVRRTSPSATAPTVAGDTLLV